MYDNMAMTGLDMNGDATFSDANSTSSPIIVDSITLVQMKNDLEAILENYLYELNNTETHQLIEQNISSYFSGAWSEYPVIHLSVSAISEHGVGVALMVGDTPIAGDIGADYRVDEYNVDFSITPEDIGYDNLRNFGAFLKEWVNTVEGTAEDQNCGVDLEEELLRAVSQDLTVEIDPALLRPSRAPSVEDILFSTIKNT